MSWWLRARLLLVALLVTTLVMAEEARIVVVAPAPQDTLLVEAARHLRGELAIHDFRVEEAPSGDVGVKPDALAALAERERAVAAISFVRRGDGAGADVWLSDRATGKTSIRTLSIEQGADAARMLAIRTVDLLRASLSELEQVPAPSPQILGRVVVPPAPALRLAARVRRAELRVEALALLPTAEPTPSFGALFGIGYHGDSADFRLSLSSALAAAHIENRVVRARLRQDVVLAEALRRLLDGPRGFVALGVGVGAQRLQVEGTAEPPWLGKASNAWSATFALGADTELALSRTWSIGLNARALLLTPRPVVDLGPEQRSLGVPTLAASGGARARF